MTAAAEIREYLDLAAWVAKNCGTGAGGFQPGNRCAHGGTPNPHRRAHGRWRAQERRRKPLNAEHADWIRHWKGERRDTARYVRKERRTLRKEQRAERRTLHRESQRDIRKLKARHARETAGSKNPARTAERHREERGDLASRIREDRREKHGEQAEERATARQDHRDHVHDALETIRTEHAEILRGRREDRQDDSGKTWRGKAIGDALDRLQSAADRLLLFAESGGNLGNGEGVWANTLGWKSGSGCGTGAGGFQPGNHCQTGGHGGVAAGPKKPRKKPGKPTAKPKNRAKKVGGKVHAYATARERQIAKATGGKHIGDHTPMDVTVPRKGGKGEHCLEVKTMTFGAKDHITMHADAKLRKVEHAEAHPADQFHTVLIDHRDRYEGGKRGQNYSGHDLYYKRGASDYKIKDMHPVKDEAELNRLIHLPDHKLPPAARGSLPTGEALTKLREQAAHDSEQRKTRDKKRKTRQRDERRAEREAAAAHAET